MSFVHNETKCALCGKMITTCDDIMFVPSIFCHQDDPLFLYNDMICHKDCFNSMDNCDKVLNYIKLVRNEYKRKRCCICKKKILSADDFVFVPIISSNSNDIISKYNCKSFHKECYEQSGLKTYLENSVL